MDPTDGGGEPLLGVRIPEGLGRETEGYRAPGPGGTQLAVVLQAFDDPLAQACLAGICALYVNAGVRLVAVEAAKGPIQPRPGVTDIEQLIATETVSAGVLSLLNGTKVTIDVWGVDKTDLIPPSHAAMETVSGARPSRDRVFAALRPHLVAVQERHYPPELAELRRGRLGLYETRKTLVEQARLGQAATERAGVALRSFPLVERFLDMALREKKLNPKRARRQQEEFVRRVIGTVHGWYKPAGGNRIDIDLRKAAPVIGYWLEETGQSMEEFTAAVDRQNLEPLLHACKEWYDSWLTAKASSGGASHELMEQMMRMALRLEVPYFDLRDLRESVAQSRDTVALKVGLDDELSDLADALVDRTGARELGDLEDRLDLVHRMLQLAVPSKDAEAKVEALGTLEELVDEVRQFAGGAAAKLDVPRQDLARAQTALDAMKEFLRFSRQRSEHMVARTLELIEERHEDRAVLAVGGFHARAISRAMDDYPQVSWSIVMPQVDVEAAWRQHHRRF